MIAFCHRQTVAMNSDYVDTTTFVVVFSRLFEIVRRADGNVEATAMISVHTRCFQILDIYIFKSLWNRFLYCSVLGNRKNCTRVDTSQRDTAKRQLKFCCRVNGVSEVPNPTSMFQDQQNIAFHSIIKAVPESRKRENTYTGNYGSCYSYGYCVSVAPSLP